MLDNNLNFFLCTSRLLEESERKEFLEDVRKNALRVYSPDDNLKFSEKTKEILTEDLNSLVKSNFKFNYFGDRNKLLHKNYIEKFNELNYDDLVIHIDEIGIGCGTWTFKYSIITGISYFSDDDINLIKTITTNTDEV